MNQQVKYRIGKSNIQGQGVIATQNIKPGEIIGIGIDYWLYFIPYVTRYFGSWMNHSRNSNTQLLYLNNKYYVVAQKLIKKGEEITINYDYCPWFIEGSKPWYKNR